MLSFLFEDLNWKTQVYIYGWGSDRSEDENLSLMEATMSRSLKKMKVGLRSKNFCNRNLGFGNFDKFQWCGIGVPDECRTNWVINFKNLCLYNSLNSFIKSIEQSLENVV